MQNIPQLYIIADYIETDIGNCYLAKVREWDKVSLYGDLLNKNKYELLEDIAPEYRELIQKLLNETTIHDFVKTYKSVGLYEKYKEAFEFFFKENVFYKIQNQEHMDNIVELINKLNCINNEKKNINPEIAYFQKLTQMSNERQGNVVTTKSMITNVGLYRQDVLDMTIYSLNAYFDTIARNKNHKDEVLFKSAGADIKNITLWYGDKIEKYTEFDEQDMQFINKNKEFTKNISSK